MTDKDINKTTTRAVNLERLLVDSTHVGLVRTAVERAHQATRLASRLLNFHALKCLERGLPLPPFGHTNWAYKAWNCVTIASRQAPRRQDDPELVKTLEEFMPDVARVDSTNLAAIMQFEANRWATCFTNNVYVHFAARVKSYVNRAYWLDKDVLKDMPRDAKVRRRKELTQVAFDLCSDPSGERKAPEAYRAFVDQTRARWKLDEFPWGGVPLAYHFKANDAKKADKCRAHLLLRAMWHMRIQRQVDGRAGFALVPVRTTLVPRHTQFGADTLRSLLGLGYSEHRKQMKRKRQQLKKEGPPPKRAKSSDAAGSSTFHAIFGDSSDDEVEEEEEPQEPEESGPKKRVRRSKADVQAEKQRDLMKLFDLKKAGIHDVKGKQFDCTFTSDGVAAHLQFSDVKKPTDKAKDKTKDKRGIPRKGIFTIEELRERIADASSPPNPAVDAAASPKAKLERLCICCDDVFHTPFHTSFICVGCDPGRNEPANMVEPLSGATLRMTLAGRKFLTAPAKPHPQHAASAAEYRRLYVDKPPGINALECEIGLEGCANAPCLFHFGLYVDRLKAREAVLVPHYVQRHHRQLRRKAFIERQRFESRFFRDVKRTFDPDRTNKPIVVAWGAWGKVAGRPGAVGNKGRPPTIGVGLARRLAKEDGIVVAWTPEHYTTKTHFDCGGECVRFAAAERQRADDHNHYEVKEIRGLKICSNPECRAPVNRDLNAAKNIAANGLLLLSGHLPIHQHSEEEVAILELENEMQRAL
jgi:hypothetical protein